MDWIPYDNTRERDETNRRDHIIAAHIMLCGFCLQCDQLEFVAERWLTYFVVVHMWLAKAKCIQENVMAFVYIFHSVDCHSELLSLCIHLELIRIANRLIRTEIEMTRNFNLINNFRIPIHRSELYPDLQSFDVHPNYYCIPCMKCTFSIWFIVMPSWWL